PAPPAPRPPPAPPGQFLGPHRTVTRLGPEGDGPRVRIAVDALRHRIDRGIAGKARIEHDGALLEQRGGGAAARKRRCHVDPRVLADLDTRTLAFEAVDDAVKRHLPRTPVGEI